MTTDTREDLEILEALDFEPLPRCEAIISKDDDMATHVAMYSCNCVVRYCDRHTEHARKHGNPFIGCAHCGSTAPLDLLSLEPLSLELG